MKYNRYVKPICKIFLFFLLLTSIAAAAIRSGPDVSEDTGEAVVLVHLVFKEGSWHIGEDGVRILPCVPPTPILEGAESDPLIRVLDGKEEIVYQRNMLQNPRIILTNPPSEVPWLLEEVSFNLRLPLIEGMELLEFCDEPVLREEEPVVSVDLREAIHEYYERGGPAEIAPCQEIEYKPDQLKR